MKKILIANRGEIALRIIKTCKRLGIATVAVYSEADRDMPFVKEADEAFLLGNAPVKESYLKADDIVQLAVQTGADAIHPGYGLLSEKADFVRKIEKAGIRFIGPDAATIEKMGDKIGSRVTMQQAGVPVIPGTDKGVGTLEEALQSAPSIGYPLMLKASAGGGGIGMVRCENEQALSQHFNSVKARAKAYFGDDVVFLEKFIADARHIEVQIFGDHYGNIVHLHERNCSVQRRNQKVIEEAPSPRLADDVRGRLHEAAVRAAKAVNYKNAGTVEFIVDENDEFYFLEMNTRLQVEHPVTEKVMGYDLVEWQIEVAKGNQLPESDQSKMGVNGHAIEYRIYAEDPVKFLPSPGIIQRLDWGQLDDVRIDSGYVEGGRVTPFYDPLIAKVIVYASTREEAIDKSREFLTNVKVEGIKTNVPFFNQFIQTDEFISGKYTTNVLNHFQLTAKGEI
ncbi:acetyl/propionyl/methylcrotonyl-CoA carboxylase subunit alpha [Sporosarcina sp. HYO08]|uniref:acetyl-CoA carboxylase biotin carboxylase subunit n=1 Tax=Sporosarcina sp. HYO08 TaxID=1759557 RepID=UPI00079666A6|nr:biotin carboxylase N-terminal domain-containing protein [Sporosarcina sp. HYO08]KXH79887.1 biotin carboxylase [Sporosarcina sp. HYO08]